MSGQPTRLDQFDLLRRVTEESLDRPLDWEEMLTLTQTCRAHLPPLAEHDLKVFILGSYEEAPHRNLQLVQEMLKQVDVSQGQCRMYPFLMVDIPGDDQWINLELKFRFLADVADHLVGVVEHDRGGFMFEQGLISGNKRYQRKTTLLKRSYPTEQLEHKNYSAMQSNGMFRKFKRSGRIFTWEDKPGLLRACGDAYHSW